MAKKATGKPAGRPRTGAAAPASPQDRVVDAFLDLLAARDFHDIGLRDIARKADVPLAEMRDLFDGKPAILKAFTKRTDRIVMEGGPAEGETGRDRLFDILMRRFDALQPHRAAVRSLARAARRDPCLGRALHRNATASLRWLTAAAEADRSGFVGALTLQGLVVVNGDALRAWLDDDDPGLAKTMAALDRGLDRGERALRLLDDVCARLGAFARRDRATRDDAAPAT